MMRGRSLEAAAGEFIVTIVGGAPYGWHGQVRLPVGDSRALDPRAWVPAHATRKGNHLVLAAAPRRLDSRAGAGGGEAAEEAHGGAVERGIVLADGGIGEMLAGLLR